MSSFGNIFLTQLFRQSPVILLYIVGMIISLAKMSRHSAISILTLIGLGICLLNSLFFSWVFAWLPSSNLRTSMSVVQIYGIVGLCSGLVHALGLALVLIAVFSGRQDQYQPGFAVETRR